MIRASARAGLWSGAAGCCSMHLVAPLSLGIVRLVESAVKPPRRITKARRRLSETAGLGTTTARGRSLGSSIWREQDASIIAPGREGSQLGGAESPRPAEQEGSSRRALALLPQGGASRQYLQVTYLRSASIIAPGREGSQSGGADTPRPAVGKKNPRH
jgi:hypothetical protein